MNSRLTAIALAIAAFVITLVILRHGDKQDGSPEPAHASNREHTQATSPSMLSRVADMTGFSGSAGSHARGIPPVAAPAPDAPPDLEPPESANTGPDLSEEYVPVALARRRATATVPNEPVIQNLSGQTLRVSVTAIAHEGGGRTSAQIELPPIGKVSLLTAGLTIEGPTTITVSSPPYRDMTSEMQ